jgi:hypothetical protein
MGIIICRKVLLLFLEANFFLIICDKTKNESKMPVGFKVGFSNLIFLLVKQNFFSSHSFSKNKIEFAIFRRCQQL